MFGGLFTTLPIMKMQQSCHNNTIETVAHLWRNNCTVGLEDRWWCTHLKHLGLLHSAGPGWSLPLGLHSTTLLQIPCHSILIICQPENLTSINGLKWWVTKNNCHFLVGLWEWVRFIAPGEDDDRAIQRSSQPWDVSMPQQSSSLACDGEVVGVCLAGLYWTLCHVRRSICPSTSKLANTVPAPSFSDYMIINNMNSIVSSSTKITKFGGQSHTNE